MVHKQANRSIFQESIQILSSQAYCKIAGRGLECGLPPAPALEPGANRCRRKCEAEALFELGAKQCRLECEERALFEQALPFEQDHRQQTQRYQ